MIESGFSKFFWGFLFVMFDFRLQGFDILPDLVGYILFAVGFGALESYSEKFDKAKKFNIVMIILSILSVYEKPAQQDSGFTMSNQLGLLGIILSIVGFVFGLIVVYNLFLGTKEVAEAKSRDDLYEEADIRWKQFLWLQIGSLFIILFLFIPIIALTYIILLMILSVVFMVKIMGYMKRCGEELSEA